MQGTNYTLTVYDDQSRRFVRRWLFLGLLLLVAAGLSSILLVLARTPVVQSLIPLAPLAGAGRPQMSNYVPVLDHPLFFAGLGLFIAGIISPLLRSWATRPRLGATLSATDVIRIGIIF